MALAKLLGQTCPLCQGQGTYIKLAGQGYDEVRCHCQPTPADSVLRKFD